jgi:predicted permease
MAGPRRFGWVPLVLATLASGALGAFLAVRPLRSEFATRPPVVILDTAEALRGVPAAQVGPVIARQRAIARRLAAGGVLVLDPQAVVAAPAGLYLRTAPQDADPGERP